MYMYPIDYSLYNQDEIVELIEFFSLIEDANEGKSKKDFLLKKYNRYINILNNKTTEKEIDKDFEKVSGYSIFRTIKEYT